MLTRRSLMKKLATILAATALAAFCGTSASAQDSQYVGHTAATFDGAQGYFVYHQACAAEFPDTVWCTSKKIIEGGPHPDAVDPPVNGAWVNPAPVGVSWEPVDTYSPRALDYSGVFANLTFHLSCERWNSNSDLRTGLIFVKTSSVGVPTFSNRICNIPRSVACCTFEPVKPPKEK